MTPPNQMDPRALTSLFDGVTGDTNPMLPDGGGTDLMDTLVRDPAPTHDIQVPSFLLGAPEYTGPKHISELDPELMDPGHFSADGAWGQ